MSNDLVTSPQWLESLLPGGLMPPSYARKTPRHRAMGRGFLVVEERRKSARLDAP